MKCNRYVFLDVEVDFSRICVHGGSIGSATVSELAWFSSKVVFSWATSDSSRAGKAVFERETV
jgi:hypothetical protein